MSDKSVQEILKRLDVLGAKLNVTGAYLWAILVRQARVEAITDVIWIVVAVIVAVVYMRLWRRWLTEWAAEKTEHRKNRDYMDDMMMARQGRMTTLIAGGALTTFVVVGALFAASELPTLIVNPEYWALKQITERGK